MSATLEAALSTSKINNQQPQPATSNAEDSPDDEGPSTSNFLVGKLEELDEDELPAPGGWNVKPGWRNTFPIWQKNTSQMKDDLRQNDGVKRDVAVDHFSVWRKIWKAYIWNYGIEGCWC